MNIASKLRKSLNEKWCMRFKTTNPDGDHYDGVIMAIKNSFVVLREEGVFEFQGMIILPKRTIKGYRDGKYEKCMNAILRQNQQIARLQIPNWLANCDSIPDVLEAIKQKDIWPCIEIIYDGVSQLYIGPIIEVTDRYFHIRHYTAEGKWDKVYIIDYSWLLKIEFADKYTKYFNEYMRSQPEPVDA